MENINHVSLLNYPKFLPQWQNRPFVELLVHYDHRLPNVKHDHETNHHYTFFHYTSCKLWNTLYVYNPKPISDQIQISRQYTYNDPCDIYLEMKPHLECDFCTKLWDLNWGNSWLLFVLLRRSGQGHAHPFDIVVYSELDNNRDNFKSMKSKLHGIFQYLVP